MVEAELVLRRETRARRVLEKRSTRQECRKLVGNRQETTIPLS